MSKKIINPFKGVLFKAQAGILFKLIICIACGGYILKYGVEGIINYIFNPESIDSFHDAVFNIMTYLFILIYGLIQFQIIFLWEQLEKRKIIVEHWFLTTISFLSIYLIIVSFILTLYFFTTTMYYLFDWFRFIENITEFSKIRTYLLFIGSLYLFYVELNFNKALKNIVSDF